MLASRLTPLLRKIVKLHSSCCLVTKRADFFFFFFFSVITRDGDELGDGDALRCRLRGTCGVSGSRERPGTVERREAAGAEEIGVMCRIGMGSRERSRISMRPRSEALGKPWTTENGGVGKPPGEASFDRSDAGDPRVVGGDGRQ